MKPRLLIISALMATALFAQGPGGPGGPGGRRQANGPNTAPTPPTPAQAATRQLNMLAGFLRLDAAQSTQLLASPLLGQLTTEETTLQTNAAILKADWTTAEATIAGGGTPDLSGINTANAGNLAARATAASQVIAALKALGVTVSSNQQTMLINMLVRGGGGPGPGGFRGGRRF
jgi:hypothetical protein